VLIAVYVVVGAVLQWAFDVAAFEDALEKIRSVTHLRAGDAAVAAVALHAIPQVGMAITIGLLVPLCGYLGVKQNHPWLMGCFCSCNALHCCCGIMSLLCLAGLVFGTTVAAPGVQAFLEMCDPVMCAPDGLNRTAQDHVVDCLAAGTWQEYKPHFPDGPRYPSKCPKIFLTCHDAPEEPAIVSFKHAWGKAEIESKGTADGHAAPARSLSIRRQVPQVMEPHFRGRRPMLQTPPPEPSDPIVECKPAEVVEKFHQARLLVPALIPKLVAFLFMKMVLTIPVIVLGCLGFCWGKDLWQRLCEGYSQLAGPPVALQAGVPVVTAQAVLQPAQGHAAAPAAAGAQAAPQHVGGYPAAVQAVTQPAAAQPTALQSTEVQLAQPLIATPSPLQQLAAEHTRFAREQFIRNLNQQALANAAP